MTSGPTDLEDARMLVRTVDAKIEDIRMRMKAHTGKKGRMQCQMLQEEIDILLKGLHYSIAKRQLDESEKAVELAKISEKPTALTCAHFVSVEDCEKQPELPSRRKAGNDEVITATIEGIVERVSTILSGKSADMSELAAACRGISPAILATELGPQVKKALTTKAQSANGLRVVEALAFATCLQYQLFPTLLTLFHDGKKAVEAAILVITETPSHGRAIVPFLQPLLQSIVKPSGGKWKIKGGALEVLDSMVCVMRETCPHQSANALPRIVPVLRDCVTDTRAEIRTKAKGILSVVGKMVTCPEVRMVSDDLIACLVDSANMKAASDMLNRLANTTFLHHVDAASFALLFPIVSRAMKERAQETQQKGVMIVGASALLVAEPTVVLPPYLPILLPLVKNLLSEPQIVLQREAAKCVGTLSLALPHVREIDLLPFLLAQLEQSNGSPEMSENDRTGAALGLSEVISQIPRFMSVLLPVVGKRLLGQPAAETFPERKAGAYSLLEVVAKNDGIVPHLPLVWPWILRGLIDASTLVRDHAFAAGKAIVHEVGAPNADVLLPSLIDSVLTVSDFNGRDLTMQLFSQLCDRLSELRKFGQDLLSMDALAERSRHALCCLILICRTDSDPAVRRLASLLWKDSIQSGQKAKREILPTLMKALKGLKSATAPAKVEAATRCIEEMERSGDFEAGEVDEQTDSGLFVTIDWENLDLGAELAATCHVHVHTNEDDDAETIDWDELEERTLNQISVATFPPAWNEVSEFLHAFIVSTALESPNAEAACTAAMDELHDPSLTESLESIYRAVFKGYHHESADTHVDASEDHDLICKVKDLMLMYGGGHLLLKNTTLELRKGQRYGVVGRNGAGKTTLMNLIANGGVAKMPSHVRVVHVHHEQLLMASDDSCLVFVGKNNPDCSPKQLEAALGAVQFPQDMWQLSINELSGGWRMRLLLASAMIRGADVLLLDEPTNHLDVGAIAWLADYLNTLENAAIMVISHDPVFLDKACTDIIQYSQEKLVYHQGNFSQFKEKLHISEEEAELLIQGNAGDVLGGESGPASERPDDSDRGEETTPARTENTADRKAKITFPVPGKVQGLTSSSKPVMELKNIVFGYSKDTRPVLNDISCKLTMNSRVAILGVNGAGKSTLLNLLCQEIHPAASALGEKGSVVRHRNCRLAYLAQQHEFHLAEFLGCAPFVYIQKRFQHGWDEALQQRLTLPKNEEEAADRVARAKKHGKYGNEVETLVGRQLRGSDLWYEVKWKTLDDPKQNSWENMVKLRDLGVESFALALDARMQAQAANLDQRPLTQREIVKHMEQFGLTEEMVLNRNIGMFSAGQRSKMTLGAAMWIKPHVIALDEPTNYIDMETLDSLAVALNRFKGAVVTISHSKEFVTRVCTEQWLLEGGTLTVSKCIDAFEKMETRT